MPSSDTSVVVYPVARRFLGGIPTTAVRTSAAIAKRLVETGAYTEDQAAADDAPEGGWPEPVELSDESIAALDHYHNLPDETPPADAAVESKITRGKMPAPSVSESPSSGAGDAIGDTTG